jgi:branched-chain amino acid transport system permease protein
VTLPLITGAKSSGELVYLTFPAVRIAILVASIALGILMWLALNKTRIGMVIRAGVDDRDMLAASGVKVQYVFILVFAFGAGLAGMAGIVGGTFQSLSAGEDMRFLLAALGAVLIGLAEQLGSVYAPTYSVVLTFLIMALVLAFRPQGLLGR